LIREEISQMATIKKESSGKKKGKGVKKGTFNEKETKRPAPFSAKQDAAPYFVGMGASAGGLEAFEKFFQNMPKTL
jgi:chemotaxis response regulator CheB